MQVHERLKQPGVLQGFEDVLNRHSRFLCTCLLRHAVVEAGRKDLIPTTNAIEEIAEGEHYSLGIVNGKLMFATDDDGIGREIKKGSYEKGITYLTRKFLKPGMIALDVGANIGIYTLLLSELVGVSGRVAAFEPDPINFNYLKKNLLLNGATNVVAYKSAVSDEQGPGRLYLAEDRNWGDHRTWQDDNRKNTVGCQKVRIDDVVEGGVDFMKVDTQGDELRVFLGAQRVLSQSPDLTVLTEFWPWGINQSGPGTATDLMNLLYQHEFEISLWSDKDSCGYRVGKDMLKTLIRDNEGMKVNLIEMIAFKGKHRQHQQ